MVSTTTTSSTTTLDEGHTGIFGGSRLSANTSIPYVTQSEVGRDGSPALVHVGQPLRQRGSPLLPLRRLARG
jgi:hypothetical protein